MSKKADSKKGKTAGVELSVEESEELQMVLDRLAVQDPEGESLGTYLKSLLKVLSGRERLMAALIDHLGRNPTPVGFKAFVAFQEAVRDKSYRRLVKQAAYRFSQKGFAAVSDTHEERVVLVPREARRPVAYLIPLSGTYGFVVSFFPESVPTPVILTAFAEGEVDRLWIRVADGSHRLFRDYLRTIEEKLEVGRRVIEIPMHHAARLVFELLDWSGGKGGSAADAAQAVELLRPFHDLQRKPPVYELMAPVDKVKERLADVPNEELLKVLDISLLLPSRNELEPYHYRFLEIVGSVLVVSPEMQQGRILDLLRTATNEIIVDSKRLFYQRYFEEKALVLKSSGREELAQGAWILAQYLQSAEEAGLCDLLVNLFMTSLRYHWPDDFSPAAAPDQNYAVGESGLILPP